MMIMMMKTMMMMMMRRRLLYVERGTKSGQLGLLSSQLEMVTFSRLLSRCTPHRNGNACCPVPLWTYQ